MYPTGQTSNIGTLLRMIREDQNKSVAATPPAAQSGSAIRELVQEPLSSPEDPGSSRVVSLRPEAVTQSGAAGVQPTAPASPTTSTTPSVVAPIVPAPPTPSPSAPANPSPSAPQPSGSSSAIGTTIRASAPAVLGSSTKAAPSNTFTPLPGLKYFTPPPSRVGGIITTPNAGSKPTPTPAPQQKSNKSTIPIIGNWLA